MYHLPFSDGNTTIDRHNLFEPGHIEALLSMKDLIENSIYVGSENNEDGRKPELVKFHYFAAGININNNDFTAKVVFTENNKGEFYYDQSLSTIEKGRFVDILQEKNKLETSSPQKKAEDSFELLKDANAPFEYYDKRLINICQVPQMPYLNKELLPTKETIEAVRNGQLKIEKSGYKKGDFKESRIRRKNIGYCCN